MGQIEEVFDDIKGALGDKGWLIFVGIAVVFGLYNLVKGSGSSDDNLVPVTTVSSYPDTVTNANVIIDTLQNSIEYSQLEMSGQLEGMETNLSTKIEGLETNLSTKLEENFEATSDYINKGLESQNKLLDESFDEIHGTLEGITENYNELSNSVNNIASNQNSLSNSIGSISSNQNALNQAVENIKVELSTKQNTSPIQSSVGVGTVKSAIQSSVGVGTVKTSNTYTYKAKAGLNTSSSIVDALKATGADSSFANRAKIYYANGGTGTYTGSATQNAKMLNQLKAGTLKKV